MAIIAACTLEPGVYLSMNIGGAPTATVAQVTALGFPVTVDQMNQIANQIGEKTLFGRTGGAATLAVGMAHIFSRAARGRWLDLWYHFAIMFEALFILTTLDAGTRVGRYFLQDVLGNVWKPLGETRNMTANILASVLMVSGWGYFLIQGVRDPLGGINSLWPLFGIANQMLAAIALCLATTIILKMKLQPESTIAERESTAPKPALALLTLIPLAWLLTVTMTAGVQKIFHTDSRIGFLAQARVLQNNFPSLEQELARKLTPGLEAYVSSSAREMKRIVAPLNKELAQLQETLAKIQAANDVPALDRALRILQAKKQEYGPLLAFTAAKVAVADNRALHFNNLLDACVAAFFLTLVTAIVLLSLREWILLSTRRKPAVLHESQPVWLPDYAVTEGARNLTGVAGAAALAVALARELSGEEQLARAHHAAQLASCGHTELGSSLAQNRTRPRQPHGQLYLEVTEQRFNGIRRCC